MKKIDALLKKVEQFERLAVYGDRKTFLQRLAQEASYDSFKGSTMVGDSGTPDAPAQNPQQVKETVIFPPIDPKVQSMLNDLLVPEGDILPLKMDGEKGPRTQKALEAFMKRFQKPGTPEAVAAVHKAQKGQAIAQKPQGTAPLAIDPDFGARPVPGPKV